MNINDMTIGEAKEISSMFNQTASNSLNCMIGEKVIIRTYSAGVWFGTLDQKAGEEVILSNARRMWKWWAKKSISLSAVAIHGIIEEKSKIVEPVNAIWLKAIEIIPCSNEAITSIEGADNVTAS